MIVFVEAIATCLYIFRLLISCVDQQCPWGSSRGRDCCRAQAPESGLRVGLSQASPRPRRLPPVRPQMLSLKLRTASPAQGSLRADVSGSPPSLQLAGRARGDAAGSVSPTGLGRLAQTCLSRQLCGRPACFR